MLVENLEYTLPSVKEDPNFYPHNKVDGVLSQGVNIWACSRRVNHTSRGLQSMKHNHMEPAG